MKKTSTLNYYQRSERRGFIVLVVIALVLLAIPAFKGLYYKPQSVVTSTQPPVAIPVDSVVTVKPFDPNQDSESELIDAGLPVKVAASLVKFRNSGGRFCHPKDLMKLYVMTPELYERLEPHVRLSWRKRVTHTGADRFGAHRRHTSDNGQIIVRRDYHTVNFQNDRAAIKPYHMPEQYNPTSMRAVSRVVAHEKQTPVITPIDINMANLEDWVRLPGIGKYYAGRILRFKESLGGFSSVEQVGTCYGLPDSVFMAILPWLRYETGPAILDYNNMTAEELSAHPYISKRQATAIVNARTQAGGRLSVQQLQKLMVFDAVEWDKIKPYVVSAAGSEQALDGKVFCGSAVKG